MKLDPYLTLYMKYNSKWIKDKYKNRKYKTTRQKHSENFSWHWSVQWFLWYDPQNISNKSKNRQMDGIKLKSFCTSNKTSNRVKRQHTGWKEILISANHIPEKRLKYMRLKQLIINKIFNLEWKRVWIDISQKKTGKQPTAICNITNHQGNANQNHNEILFHICQNHYYPKDK